ncbi:hypothetical protein T08_7734 [Trichinella sp. T8]|nr:hypothetical protein T08_7734 [Trichinella sp. T8]
MSNIILLSKKYTMGKITLSAFGKKLLKLRVEKLRFLASNASSLPKLFPINQAEVWENSFSAQTAAFSTAPLAAAAHTPSSSSTLCMKVEGNSVLNNNSNSSSKQAGELEKSPRVDFCLKNAASYNAAVAAALTTTIDHRRHHSTLSACP